MFFFKNIKSLHFKSLKMLIKDTTAADKVQAIVGCRKEQLEIEIKWENQEETTSEPTRSSKMQIPTMFKAFPRRN